jgi:hypothetical protein
VIDFTHDQLPESTSGRGRGLIVKVESHWRGLALGISLLKGGALEELEVALVVLGALGRPRLLALKSLSIRSDEGVF